MKDVIIITDPEVVKLLSDQTRFKILKLLRQRPMSINELSDATSKDRTTIYRHVKALEKAGLIEEIENRGNEKVYARAARLFLVKADPHESVEEFRQAYIQIEAEKLVDILEKAGFRIKNRKGFLKLAEEVMNAIELKSQPVIKKISSADIDMSEIELFHLLNMLVFFQSCELCEKAEKVKELIEI